jgi:hypothetical protein
VNRNVGFLDPDLTHLEEVWESGMRDIYEFYTTCADPMVAMAAAMVETAAELQQLGGLAADPPSLLLGDLCLARASRLLAATGDQRLQVGFARAVERVSAAAAAGAAADPVRDQLVALMNGAT